MTKEQTKIEELTEGASIMTDDDWPIGMLENGQLNIVDKDAPPWKPKVVDEDGNDVDPDSIEPDEE